MEEAPRIETPSIRQHKRQFTWQILVPVIAFAVIVIAAAVFVTTRGSTVDRTVADISAIWLILPVLILAFIFLALVSGLIYGTIMLHRITPKYSGKLQDILYAIQRGARKASDGAAKPFFWIDTSGAALRRIFKGKR